MDQYLVNDDLEEQRGDQPEQLQHEGGDEHLDEETPVFVQGSHEPGEPKAPAEFRERGPFRNQNQGAIPERLERRARNDLRPQLAAILDQHLVLANLGEDDEAASVGAAGYRR